MTRYKIGPWTFDPETGDLSTQSEPSRHLNPAEMNLVRVLAEKAPLTVPLSALTNPTSREARGALHSAVYRANTLLGRRPDGSRFIQATRWPDGYRILDTQRVETKVEPSDFGTSEMDRTTGAGRPVALGQGSTALHQEPDDVVNSLERLRSAGQWSFAPPRLSQQGVDRLVARYRARFGQTIDSLDGQVLSRGAYAYPVVTFRSRGGQPFESVLPSKSMDARIGAAAEDPATMAIRSPLARLQRRLAGNSAETPREADEATRDGWNICMRTLRRSRDGELSMTARLARYGLILDTCDALIDEAFVDGGDGAPLRDAVDDAEDPFVSGEHRAAGIGIAALMCVVEREPSGSYVLNALIAKRSAKVGTYQDVWHVAPAGMFNWRFASGPDGEDGQPWGSYDAGDILRSILVEYAEEAHNIEEMKDADRRTSLDNHAKAVALQETAQIEFTGIALDLANLRPEICLLIYVRKVGWRDNQNFELNYEYKDEPTRTGEHTSKRILTAVTVARDTREFDDMALAYLKPEATVASGAASFWLGVDRARQLFREDLRTLSPGLQHA